MRRKAVMFATGLMMAATVALAPAAGAQELCAGTEDLGYVCVDPTGRTLIDDCVYLGPPPCIPVSVPGPTIRPCIFVPRPTGC